MNKFNNDKTKIVSQKKSNSSTFHNASKRSESLSICKKPPKSDDLLDPSTAETFPTSNTSKLEVEDDLMRTTYKINSKSTTACDRFIDNPVDVQRKHGKKQNKSGKTYIHYYSDGTYKYSKIPPKEAYSTEENQSLISTCKNGQSLSERPLKNDNISIFRYLLGKSKFCIIVVIIAIVGIALTVANFQSKGSQIKCRDDDFSQFFDYLKTISSEDSLLDKNSPQRKALDWLLCDDTDQLQPLKGIKFRVVQRYTVMVLFFSVNPIFDSGGNWGIPGIHECEWKKISCRYTTVDSAGVNLIREPVVTHINLKGSKSSNYIPSEIGNLSYLEFIDFSLNKLEGTLPGSIYGLTELKELHIGNNKIGGTIDARVGSLSKITHLSMQNCGLSGKLPNSLKQLENLEFLHLQMNELSGGLFYLLQFLPKLTQVNSRENNFSGSIIEDFSLLSNLEYVDTSRNKFTGLIPSELTKLSSLTFLNLSYNSFKGKLPSDIGSLTNLVGLQMQHCHLTGTIPNSISNLRNLEILDLSHNKIKLIPNNVNTLKNLVEVNLGGNNRQ